MSLKWKANESPILVQKINLYKDLIYLYTLHLFRSIHLNINEPFKKKEMVLPIQLNK